MNTATPTDCSPCLRVLANGCASYFETHGVTLQPCGGHDVVKPDNISASNLHAQLGDEFKKLAAKNPLRCLPTFSAVKAKPPLTAYIP